MRPWLGQITYTMIAAQALFWTAFNQTIKVKYITDIDEKVFFEASRYYWGDSIHGYFWLVFWSVALLTQLMSDFGVGAELNTRVWIIGLSVGGMLINLVTNVLWYMDMNTCLKGPLSVLVYERGDE